jgi:hypothetical protein
MKMLRVSLENRSSTSSRVGRRADLFLLVESEEYLEEFEVVNPQREAGYTPSPSKEDS